MRVALGRHLRAALAAWTEARDTDVGGGRLRVGLAYQRAMNHLLLYVTLVRAHQRSVSEGRAELLAACHALSVLGQEAVPKISASRAPHHADIQARAALAGAHLADPAHGDHTEAARALEAPPVERFAPDGRGDVTAAERIAVAAEARLLLAELIADHPPARGARGRPWRITSEPAASRLIVVLERRRFRRAVLPSCQGLSARSEAETLGEEALALYAALARERPSYADASRRARERYREVARVFDPAAIWAE